MGNHILFQPTGFCGIDSRVNFALLHTALFLAQPEKVDGNGGHLHQLFQRRRIQD